MSEKATSNNGDSTASRAPAARWVGRITVVYMAFCLAKGLLWLAVGAGIVAALR